jgi:prolipoprotein diacylglyceryltransferase
VQIYEAFGFLNTAGIVIALIRRATLPGVPALAALLGIGLTELLAEAFRSPDVSATILGGLRLGQVLGLLVALVGLAGLRALLSRSQAVRPHAPGALSSSDEDHAPLAP